MGLLMSGGSRADRSVGEGTLMTSVLSLQGGERVAAELPSWQHVWRAGGPCASRAGTGYYCASAATRCSGMHDTGLQATEASTYWPEQCWCCIASAPTDAHGRSRDKQHGQLTCVAAA